MPRYVILNHDWPTPHWDLFLEVGPVLRAWRLLAAPREQVWLPALVNHDHRLVYLDYEGPVSGGRGSVRRVARGHYEILQPPGDSSLTAWMARWDSGFAQLRPATTEEATRRPEIPGYFSFGWPERPDVASGNSNGNLD